MNELVPLLFGLALGALLGLIRPQLHFAYGLAAAIPLGVAATIVTGEYRISWEFVLIDIPLVAGSAALALYLARTARQRRSA